MTFNEFFPANYRFYLIGFSDDFLFIQICIKSASAYNGDVSVTDKQLQKQQLADIRKTQRLKKQSSPSEIKVLYIAFNPCLPEKNKSCFIVSVKNEIPVKTKIWSSFSQNSSMGDVSLPELPPTPPSSVSAPETPQPSLVNGEAPVSPTEDVTRMDFETSTINLDELIGDSKDTHSDVNCFPLLLNQVIVDPLIRPKKRQLSEADYVVVNGERKYKKRRNRKRNSFESSLKANVAARLALAYSPVRKIHKTPEDLEKLVHRYFKDEQKVLADEETKRIASNDSDEYRIRGKRRTLDGRVEYLVECVKCTRPL